MIILHFFFNLSICLSFSTVQTLHDFHISKCNIEFNDVDSTFQISMQLFIDDLESALKEQGQIDLFIGTEKEKEIANSHIEDYINQKFSLSINQITRNQLTFLGKETSQDLSSVWCYLELSNIEYIKSISIKNNILMEIFSDQKNIIKIQVPGEKDRHFLSQIGNIEKKLVYKSE